MHFVIMGCGRGGATLADSLEDNGHSVAIIDQSVEAFRRLSTDFAGKRVTGIGFDRDTLEQADIADAYAFAAVSDGDNSNIIAARVVRETFGIDNVVARIYDRHRAEIYQRLGIPTVATVRWTADQVLRRMLPMGATEDYVDPSGTISLNQVDVHPSWYGTSIAAIDRVTGARTAYVLRDGQGLLASPTTVLQENDTLHMLMQVSEVPTVERLMTNPPKGTQA